MMQCERCGGTGQGTLYERCPACRGRGRFEPPDYAAILRAIRGRKGLRSRPPAGAREYYVWRLARFYGGQDVTMPVLAFVRILGDPYQADLDALARSVAKRVFGTDLAAAARWAPLLGLGSLPEETLDRLPPTARMGGPVVIGDKPVEELMEILG